MLNQDRDELPIAIIGAGAVGLAAAAHATERGLPFVLFESGSHVGTAIRQWAHVQLFSPWSLNIDSAARRLLESTGWTSPAADVHPTGGELIERYLEPLGAVAEVASVLRPNHRVLSVTRLGLGKVRSEDRGHTPFVVTTVTPDGVDRTLVRAVIDASGTWLRPNPIGAEGRPAIGEDAAADAIHYGIPNVLGSDRKEYAGRRVAVIGSGHSAQNVVRDLAALAEQTPGTRVVWVIRRHATDQMFGGSTDDPLPDRRRLSADSKAVVESGRVSLITGFSVQEVRRAESGYALTAADGRTEGPFDLLVGATGFRPDLEPLSELRLDIDPALESARPLAPLIDPNVHSCGTVPPHGAAELAHPEPDLYIVGAKSYGRAPTFLLATGYEQVRSVVAKIAGDHEAAREVCLALAQKGSCSAATVPAGVANAPGCCA